ncbi:MAG: DUF2341 domain-containing protein [Fibrobacteria bacterium]|nr:DUF2341 domain-containing protein [Fibrobacteria bacterium]
MYRNNPMTVTYRSTPKLRTGVKEDVSGSQQCSLVKRRKVSFANLINIKSLFLSFVIWVFFLILSCSTNVADSGGSAGETGNAIVLGHLTDSVGTPLWKASARLLPTDFDPVKDTIKYTALTNKDGNYKFTGVHANTYNVEAVQAEGKARVLVTNIVVPEDSTIEMVTCILKQPATLTIPLSADVGKPGEYVYVQGTNSYVQITTEDLTAGSVVIENIPQGSLPEIMQTGTGENSRSIIYEGVFIASSGAVVASAYAAWDGFSEIYINTSATGANVEGMVNDFPLFIHLDSTNFDFSVANSNGSDIRFAKINGIPMSYEIEEWNAATKSAAIWVKVDTIYGHRASEFFRMHWGNSSAMSRSNGQAVFPSSSQFAAVWHLDSSLNDASANTSQGTNTGTQDNMGVTGRARYFDGISSTISIPSSNSLNRENGSLSISLWVKTPGGLTAEGIIFEHGIWGESGNYQLSALTDQHVTFDFPEAGGETLTKTLPQFSDNQWHQLVLTFDDPGDTAAFYFDGKHMITKALASSISDGAGPINIGSRNGSSLFFKGWMDELRVSSTTRSPHWVKLCYENQKQNQILLQIK